MGISEIDEKQLLLFKQKRQDELRQRQDELLDLGIEAGIERLRLKQDEKQKQKKLMRDLKTATETMDRRLLTMEETLMRDLKTATETMDSRLLTMTETLTNKSDLLDAELAELKELKTLTLTNTEQYNHQREEKLRVLDAELTQVKERLHQREEKLRILDAELTQVKERLHQPDDEVRILGAELTHVKERLHQRDEEVRILDAELTQVKGIQTLESKEKSFWERKEKFDHQRDEKLRTFFLGFTADTAILSCFILVHSSPNSGQFHSLLLALTTFIGCIFLTLSVHLCVSIWDLRSSAENLEIEKVNLASDFKAEAERKCAQRDPFEVQRDPGEVPAEAKEKCLQNVHINFEPLVVTGGFILVSTIAFLVTQIILLFKVS